MEINGSFCNWQIMVSCFGTDRSWGMKRNKLYYILFVLYILATAFVLYVNGIFTGNVASFLNLAINGVFLLVIGIMFVICGFSFARLNRCTDELVRVTEEIQKEYKEAGEKNLWASYCERKELFQDVALKDAFGKYLMRMKTLKTRYGYTSVCDVEEYINEDLLDQAGMTHFNSAMGGTLTGLGILGTFLGIVSAVRQNSLLDNAVMVLALIGTSAPIFWIGILMIILFSVNLGWLPPSGFGSFKQLIMPALALGMQSTAVVARMTRSSMLEVIRQDFVKTARAKGQKESVVIMKHVFRNALIPVITVVGLQFGTLLGGAMLTEVVFSIPGVGRLMIEAIKQRDFPIVQGSVLFVAACFSLVNLAVDLLYAVVDPKVSKE